MSTILRTSLQKLFAGLALAAGACLVSPAMAQDYSSSFSYYNPRTGFSYSQGWSLGQNSYIGGFSYSNRGRSMSSSYGYSGRNHYQSQSYNTNRFGYGRRAWFGNGRLHQRSYYYGQ